MHLVLPIMIVMIGLCTLCYTFWWILRERIYSVWNICLKRFKGTTHLEQQRFKQLKFNTDSKTLVNQGSGNEPQLDNEVIKWLECEWGRPFPVNGQGTFIFNNVIETKLLFSVENENGDYSMALYIDRGRAYFLQFHGEGNHRVLTCADGAGSERGKVSYWYSYDRDNLVLKYGKGYRMTETTLMVHDFLKDVKPEYQDKIREDLYPYFNAEGQKFVREYTMPVSDVQDGIEVTEPLVEFDKNPFICNIPPLVLDSSKTNLFILDQSKYVFSASLPLACQELYQNISNCRLNNSEEQDDVLLSDAIRYSIDTDGCILNEKLQLKGKSTGDLQRTYLRVTLGHSLGKSPGIPYVLEIWPKGHYSPIHNHGNANAVIKVLFGTILLKVYNKHTKHPNSKPLKEMEIKENDVTWIDRNWYQTHQLHNKSEDFCATIQCYNYAAGDTTHWPYFDYIKDQETIAEFLPNSDFTFQHMHTQVMNEYRNHNKIN